MASGPSPYHLGHSLKKTKPWFSRRFLEEWLPRQMWQYPDAQSRSGDEKARSARCVCISAPRFVKVSKWRLPFANARKQSLRPYNLDVPDSTLSSTSYFLRFYSNGKHLHFSTDYIYWRFQWASPPQWRIDHILNLAVRPNKVRNVWYEVQVQGLLGYVM